MSPPPPPPPVPAPPSPESPRAAFEAFLRGKRLKLTKPRMSVMESALTAKRHFEPEELVSTLRDKAVSRATVYRTLALLLEGGLLREVIEDRGRRIYEPMHGMPHHDHLVCVGCGEIIEFTNPRIEALQEAVCRHYGFEPVSHLHQIMGYCRRCRRRASVRKGRRP